MAIPNEITTRRTVTQKPELNSDQWSVRTSSNGLVVLDQLDGFVDRMVGGSPVSPVYLPIHCSWSLAHVPSSLRPWKTPLTKSTISVSPFLMPAP